MVCQSDYGYEVRAGLGAAWHDVGGFSNAPCSNPWPGYKFTGLTPWTTYVLSVRAYHLVDGAKVYSPEASLTTSTTTIDGFVVPSAPRSLTTLVSPASGVGSGEVHLRWDAPALDGGTPITRLRHRAVPPTGRPSWLPIVDRSLIPLATPPSRVCPTDTRVYFRVLAVSEVGTGLASTVVNATPRTVPGAPESLTATPSDGVISVGLAGSGVHRWLRRSPTTSSSVPSDGTSGWVNDRGTDFIGPQLHRHRVWSTERGPISVCWRSMRPGRSAASDVVDTVSRSVASPPQLLTAAPVQCLWAGAALLVGPGLGWGRSDHGLHDRALAQRDVGLADDQRRRAVHHDLPHGHRSDQRHPRLLPRFCRQRRRQLSLLQHVLRCSAFCGYSSRVR